jgi:hypothetical protein
MVAKLRTAAFHGVESIEFRTQVKIASGLPALTAAIAATSERVWSAWRNVNVC